MRYQIRREIIITTLIATIPFIFSAMILQQNVNKGSLPFIKPDSQGYIETSKYFLGENPRSSIVNYRLFGPVIPLLAAGLNLFMEIVCAYIFLNYVFLLFSSFLLFYYFKRIFSSNIYGYAGTTLFTTSMPVILWTPTVLLDIGSWFGISFLLFYTAFPTKHKLFDLIIRVFLYTLAILIKPTLVFIVFFCWTYQFLIKKEYLKSLFTIITSICLVLYIYSLLGLSLEYFTQFGYPRHRHILLVISAVSFAFNSLVPFSIIGIIKFKDVLFKSQLVPKGFIEMNLLYLIFSLAEFLIFVHTPRLVFITYPFILTCSLYGFAYLSKKFLTEGKTLITLVLFNVICSNFTAYIYQSGILLSIGRNLVGNSWN